MSNIFDDREKQFEAKFKHDEELRFKVTVRRNRLLGLWAAEQLGLSGKAAEDYAKALIDKTLEKGGENAIVEKLLADFTASKLDVSAHHIERRMHELHDAAREQIMHEVKSGQ